MTENREVLLNKSADGIIQWEARDLIRQVYKEVFEGESNMKNKDSK